MESNTPLPRALRDGLMAQTLEDELLIYDRKRYQAHCLNQTAALVWEQCNGKTTVSQAAQSLQSKLGMPVGTDVILLAVKQLQRFHLVEGSQKSHAISRRTLVLKYAPAALALPVIMSITAPTPAQSASNCGGQGASCESTADCCSGCTCDGQCFCNNQ